MQMIDAYLTAFYKGDNVRFIWKVGGVIDPQEILALRRNIQRMAFNKGFDMTSAPPIIIDMNTYNHEVMNYLFNEADVYVQVSHGEAWGLPMTDAMATGTPVLTLNKGGQKSFATKKNAFFVKSSGLEYANAQEWYSIHNGVKWHGIKQDDYVNQFRYIYENQHLLPEKREACLETASKFMWFKVVKDAYKKLKKLEKQLDNSE